MSTRSKGPADRGVLFTPGPGNIRVERDGNVFWVRAIRRGSRFRADRDTGWGGGSNAGDGLIAGLIFLIIEVIVGAIVSALWDTAQERADRWKVGILRYDRDKRFPRAKIVYRERVPQGDDPLTRAADLAEEVRLGRFDQP